MNGDPYMDRPRRVAESAMRKFRSALQPLEPRQRLLATKAMLKLIRTHLESLEAGL